MADDIYKAITYAKSLIGIPYRWYDETTEEFAPNDKFYYAEEPAPLASNIILEDKSIVCAGLINLMRRKLGLSIPKYGKYPGGTVAWYNYLKFNNRIKVVDNNSYPVGTLLLKKYKNEAEQGHLAVVIGTNLIIHAYADIPYQLRHKHKNHGTINITALDIKYFDCACLPKDWLSIN